MAPDGVVNQSNKACCYNYTTSTVSELFFFFFETGQEMEYLLGDICHGLNDGLIANPHETRRDPTSGGPLSLDLRRALHLGHNMRNRHARLAVADEVKRHHVERLVFHAAPSIPMPPPRKAVLFGTAVALELHTGVVAKLEPHGRLGRLVGYDGADG